MIQVPSIVEQERPFDDGGLTGCGIAARSIPLRVGSAPAL
jgi:hypothetical protein